MTDIEIARAAEMLPIAEIADRLRDFPPEAVIPYGRHKAKLEPAPRETGDEGQRGRLVLVTAVSPTPAGEGKTTTTIGLGDGLRRIGRGATICLREPSLGPSFGQKGGAAGGGRSQVVPMDEINLHFTGDFHAIGAANNLLAALVDNHLHWGNELGLDPRRISWRRAVDLNDRALRRIVTGLGTDGSTPSQAGGDFPRETGFDITVASEVMAIFCLAENLADLKDRLGKIVVGADRSGNPVRAADIDAHGAMTALLRDALQPNLVQSLEHTPALVHGGPFANIAHGCNSVAATRLALRHSDIVVTEAGFGADLGAEKFFDIKCRQAGLEPDLAVVVATIRALKYHGGVARKDLGREDTAAVERGFANLRRHLENLEKFGIPAVVAVNAFDADSPEECAKLVALCEEMGVACLPSTHWKDGAAGAEALANEVARQLDETRESGFAPLYPDDAPLEEKLRTVAREIYRADDIEISSAVRRHLSALDETEARSFPVCIAKTPYSFGADPKQRGAVTGFTLPIREVRLSAGARFVVALTGDIMTLPGLPREPAAGRIDVDESGRITGLS